MSDKEFSADHKANSELSILLRDVKLDLKSGAGLVNILRGINLEITNGSTVSIVGPSGAGKSTLMMVIAGIEATTSGHVNILNADFSGLNEDELALFRRDNIGIVFQAFHLIPTMTALENVALPLELARDRTSIEKAKLSLSQVELLERAEHYPAQLSGGEQQRVAIARAFVTKPKILLADEPTGNLDQKTGKAAIDLLFKLQSVNRTTLVLVTHDQDLSQRCNRIVTMENGLIIKDTGKSLTDRTYEC
ncbi:MAG: hypothetical protein CMM58_00260 [Rhodospirillaceae bacterium]|nr:hypothetical protein [Rhodospirillaceae bacterium]|tara:strand:+ start:2243 stop:2989 length:747 start_codon:yes stop_codon:yes gene_type:complete